jgi:hypothetical protein
VALMKAALETKQRFRISYWDAAVIEAARTQVPSIACKDSSLSCVSLSEDRRGTNDARADKMHARLYEIQIVQVPG